MFPSPSSSRFTSITVRLDDTVVVEAGAPCVVRDARPAVVDVLEALDVGVGFERHENRSAVSS